MIRDRNEGGVSFRDVAGFLAELEKRWGGYWSFTIAGATTREGQLTLSVMLERRDALVYTQCVSHPRRYWGKWPCNDAATFAGLLFLLCNRADSDLDERERSAIAQASF